ncbi:MAG: hypothetical protein CL726_01440 [Chloroflexi bacterium]|nr:hypothetical protein [Chloroflexota bacterium]
MNLTRREFNLLDTFLQSHSTALSRVQIISQVWVERNEISYNVLNATVKTFRERLEANGELRVIHSLRACGDILKVYVVQTSNHHSSRFRNPSHTVTVDSCRKFNNARTSSSLPFSY